MYFLSLPIVIGSEGEILRYSGRIYISVSHWMPAKADILRSYRELLYVIKRLPKASPHKNLSEIKAKIRANKNVTDEAESSDLHKLLTSKIGFLRLSHPRVAGDRYAGSATFVVRDGNVVEGQALRESGWDSFWGHPLAILVSCRDTDNSRRRIGEELPCRIGPEPISREDGMKKHNQLLRRQHFGRDPPPFRPPF